MYSTLTALSVLSSSAVAVTLPLVSIDLGLREAGAGWVLAAFSIAFPVGTVTFGRVVDLYGQRRAWQWGSMMFVGGSLVAAAAPTFAVLVGGRLLQGIGAGAVPTLTLARISSSDNPMRRAGRVGVVTAVVSITSGVGPLLGGTLATLVHWRVVFALPVVALLLAPIVTRDLRRRAAGRGQLDLAGGLLTLLTLGALLIAVRGLIDVEAASLAAWAGGTGLVAAAGLVLRMRRRPYGFLRHDLITDTRLIVSGLAGLTMLATHVGAVFAIPLILADDRGWSTFQIGLAVLPAALLGVGSATAAPWFQARFGPRCTAVVAALLCLVGVGTLVVGPPMLGVLIGGLGLIGAGGLGGQVVHTTRVLRRSDDPSASSAMGLFQLLLFTGAAVGPVLVGAVAQVTSLRVGLGALLPLPVIAAVLALQIRDEPTTT